MFYTLWTYICLRVACGCDWSQLP